jgi:hypothetical protein
MTRGTILPFNTRSASPPLWRYDYVRKTHGVPPLFVQRGKEHDEECTIVLTAVKNADA